MSFDRLQKKIDEMRNPTVVGLDPALGHIPPQILDNHMEEHGETLWAAAISVFEFNAMIINAIYDIVPAVKLQLAFYEALGAEGMVVAEKTCRYARSKGMYVIFDGKRNDIGSTAEAYSAAYLGAVKVGKTELRAFDADALTVNAYLGSDGIRPFIETAVKYDKAIFALVKTSNKSAGELQDLWVTREPVPPVSGTNPPAREPDPSGSTAQKGAAIPVFQIMGELMEKISRETIGEYGFTRVGAVIGATYPDEIAFLRARLKNTFILVPGYGAQGGSAADAALAFNQKGQGAIVNSSRGIIAAWKETGGDYAGAARAKALQMRDELRECLEGG